MSSFYRILFFVLFAPLLLRGQTVSVSPVASTIGTSAGTVTLSVTLTYSGSMGSIGFQIGSVPPNWTYVSKGGANPPEVAPFSGEMGSFGFAYTSFPASPARFEFTVAHPAGLSGSQVFSAVSAIFRFSENGASKQQIVSAPNLVFSPAASGDLGSHHIRPTFRGFAFGWRRPRFQSARPDQRRSPTSGGETGWRSPGPRAHSTPSPMRSLPRRAPTR